MLCLKTAGRLQVNKWSRKIKEIRCILGCWKVTVSTDTGTKNTYQKDIERDNESKLVDKKSYILPVSAQYFSGDIVGKSEGDTEDIEQKLKEFDQSLENIKFDIENLKALKIKHQSHQRALSKEINDPEYAAKSVLIGTADPNHPPSSVPCGGCGAFLHCNDPAIPGFIPQEQFKGRKMEHLAELLCKRCTLLGSSTNKVVQMDIDKETYKQIIKKIKREKALVVMVVDLTDMANSVIPEFLHDIGKRRPIFIVGNKIDLIPKDSKGHLNGILDRLELECERASLNPLGRNIQYTCLVSAKTGYGIEQLINRLISYWDVCGNIYLVGTTNSGKSTLFNKFLDSDYCKHTCRDIVQRATVSRWPGTTLNLIKFPIMRASKWKLYLRTMRLKEDTAKANEKLTQRKENLKKYGKSQNGVLFGHVGKTDFRSENVKAEEDKKYETTGHHFPAYHFDNVEDYAALGPTYGKSSVLEQRRTILEDMYPDSKWACDTPGLINNNQLINRLTGEELKKILKREIIRPRVFVMKPGDVMFITGLARIDYLEGRVRTYVTVHTNHFLPVHVVYGCNADAFYMENVGTGNLGLPLGDSKRLEMLPSLCGRDFYFETEQQKVASADLQLSSLGWVSFAAQHTTIHIRAYTPGGRGMHLRTPALLPYITAFKGSRLGTTKEFALRKLKL